MASVTISGVGRLGRVAFSKRPLVKNPLSLSVLPRFLMSNPPCIMRTSIRSNLTPRRCVHATLPSFKYRTCWKCNHVLSNARLNLICDQCSAPQPLDQSRNYFELLGLPTKFEIDEQLLSHNLKQMQRFLHPDKFATRPENEQQYSQDASSLLNEATKILRDPYLRAVYLLKLETGDHSFDEEKDLPTDNLNNEFLGEMMELNEIIAGGSSVDCKEIVQINDKIKATIDKLTKSIAKAFENGSHDEVKQHLAQLKFFTNILDKIKAEQARCFVN